MRQRIGLLIAIGLLAILSACGGSSASADPVASSCDALVQVNEALDFTALVGPATDILDIIAAQTQLTTSWRTLVTEVTKLEDSQIPPSLVTANQAFDSIPAATETTGQAVALASVNQQSEIAQGVVDEFTPVCATYTPTP